MTEGNLVVGRVRRRSRLRRRLSAALTVSLLSAAFLLAAGVVSVVETRPASDPELGEFQRSLHRDSTLRAAHATRGALDELFVTIRANGLTTSQADPMMLEQTEELLHASALLAREVGLDPLQVLAPDAGDGLQDPLLPAR